MDHILGCTYLQIVRLPEFTRVFEVASFIRGPRTLKDTDMGQDWYCFCARSKCMYTRTHTRTHTYSTYRHTHAHMHVYTYVRTVTHAHMHVHTYIHTDRQTHTLTSSFVMCSFLCSSVQVGSSPIDNSVKDLLLVAMGPEGEHPHIMVSPMHTVLHLLYTHILATPLDTPLPLVCRPLWTKNYLSTEPSPRHAPSPLDVFKFNL